MNFFLYVSGRTLIAETKKERVLRPLKKLTNVILMHYLHTLSVVYVVLWKCALFGGLDLLRINVDLLGFFLFFCC
jgi:hypothetical protein